MHRYLIITIAYIASAHAWRAILLDGATGKTQIYTPGTPPHSVANVNLGLRHGTGAAAVVLDTRVLIIGGRKTINGEYTNTTTVFNVATNATTQGPQLKLKRYSHGAAVIGGKVIVCGGFVDGPGALATCEQTSTAVDAWTDFSALPLPISQLKMVTLNNHLYTIGGRTTNQECGGWLVYMHNDVEWVEVCVCVCLTQRVRLTIEISDSVRPGRSCRCSDQLRPGTCVWWRPPAKRHLHNYRKVLHIHSIY